MHSCGDVKCTQKCNCTQSLRVPARRSWGLLGRRWCSRICCRTVRHIRGRLVILRPRQRRKRNVASQSRVGPQDLLRQRQAAASFSGQSFSASNAPALAEAPRRKLASYGGQSFSASNSAELCLYGTGVPRRQRCLANSLVERDGGPDRRNLPRVHRAQRLRAMPGQRVGRQRVGSHLRGKVGGACIRFPRCAK